MCVQACVHVCVCEATKGLHTAGYDRVILEEILGLCLGWYGHLMVLYKTKSAIPVTQYSAQVFKRAGCHLKRAHLVR